MHLEHSKTLKGKIVQLTFDAMQVTLKVIQLVLNVVQLALSYAFLISTI